MAHVWISLAQHEDPPFTEEQLHTHPVGEDRHRLESTPAFAYGIAVGDVVETQDTADGRSWIISVAEQGDHWCTRVVPLNGFDIEKIVDVMASMGGTASQTVFGLVTVDFDAAVDVKHVMAELTAGRDAGNWDFDLGVRPGS